MREKIKAEIKWLKAHKIETFNFIIWIYVLTRFKGIRDFLIDLFKILLEFWAIALGFIVVMTIILLILALITLTAHIFMLVGVRIGILPKSCIKIKISKEEQEESKTDQLEK